MRFLSTSLQLRAWASVGAFVLLVLQSHFPEEPLLACSSTYSNGRLDGSLDRHSIGSSGRFDSAGGVGGGSGLSQLLPPPRPSLSRDSGGAGTFGYDNNGVERNIDNSGAGGSSSGGGASGGRGNGAVAEIAPMTGPLPQMVKVFGAKTEGAFATMSAGDDDSVRRAIAVCYQLSKQQSSFDCLVASPDPLEPRLEHQVRAAHALPVAVGRAPYPPQFNPKLPKFRVCWHRLRLFLLSPYRAVVALDSDVLVVNNVDFVMQRVLNHAGTGAAQSGNEKPTWFAARDETPLCEDCRAFPSGAPNAGVFGARPDPLIYAKLIHRSKFWSPWFGFDWSYAEQELLSIFFLVEGHKHGVEMAWLDNGVNFFACKLRCPNQGPPSILHFVGVPKPTDLFPAALRRSSILNNFHPAFPEFGYVRRHYVTWFERFVGAMKLSKAPRPGLLWHDHLMGVGPPLPNQFTSPYKGGAPSLGSSTSLNEAPYPADAGTRDLLWHAPNATTQKVGARAKNYVAYVDVPRTGGAAIVKALMRNLYGDKWFYGECANPKGKEAPPLCATFGNWVRPKDRLGPDKHRCTVLGCGLGHLTLPRMKEAFGPMLWRRTFTVVILRHPVDLFVSEYHYIAAELQKPQPSLQFVQDATLRDQLKAGMSLRAYAAYPHQHHDWHGSATNRQAFYLTGLNIPSLSSSSGSPGANGKSGGSSGSAPLDSKGEARKVLLKAIVTLRNADFVGVMEDMGRLVRLLSCTLGVPQLDAPSSAMLRSVLGVDTLFARPTNDSDLVRRVENLNAIDMELHEFASELFDVRWANLGILHKSGFEYC